jgi:hypothetical protein
MELTGIITQVLPLQQGVTKTGTPWQKQSYVLATDGAHARQVCYSVFNDRVASEGALQGEQVKVQCDATSREFGGRWYTEITAWRVERFAPVAAAPTTYAAPAVPTTYAAPAVAPAAPASVFVPPMPSPAAAAAATAAAYAAPAAPAPASVVTGAPAMLSNPSPAAAAILAHPTTQQYAQAFDLVPVSEGEIPF